MAKPRLRRPAKYAEMYARSIADPEGFWREQAGRLDWMKPFSKVKNVNWDPDHLSIKWFEDGSLNVTVNCIDRHLPAHSDRIAIIWEGDDPKESKDYHVPGTPRRGLPLVIGSGPGSELRTPLGVTIIGGLLLSQVLTLYTTPVIDLAMDGLKRRIERFLGIGQERDAEASLPPGGGAPPATAPSAPETRG